MPGHEGRSFEYARQAFALIDRVSEYERVHIAAGYYESTGELDKVIDAYRLGIENYPRAWGFHNNLSEAYIRLGRFEEGLKEGLSAAQLQPNAEPPYRRLLDAYMCLDRLDEAKIVAENVRVLGIGGARIHQRFLELAYIEADDAAIATETQWFAGKPEEYLSFGLQAAHRNVLGQRRESSKLYLRAAELALRSGLRNAATGFEEADARADALSGNCGTARHLGRPPLALAICGEVAQAEKLAGENSKLFPNGTIWNAVQFLRFVLRSNSSAVSPPKPWNCWQAPRPTSALTPRRCICAAWRTFGCVKARRPQPSSRRSWTTRAPVGVVHGSIRIGDYTIRFPIWV